MWERHNWWAGTEAEPKAASWWAGAEEEPKAESWEDQWQRTNREWDQWKERECHRRTKKRSIDERKAEEAKEAKEAEEASPRAQVPKDPDRAQDQVPEKRADPTASQASVRQQAIRGANKIGQIPPRPQLQSRPKRPRSARSRSSTTWAHNEELTIVIPQQA